MTPPAAIPNPVAGLASREMVPSAVTPGELDMSLKDPLSPHEEVFGSILGRDVPPGLACVPRLLEQLGGEMYGPWDLPDRMPLTTALGRDGHGDLALLHWPTPQHGISVHVVRPAGRRLELVATSVGSWVRSQLAALESEASLTSDWNEAAAWFTPGEFKTSGLPLAAWEVLKGGGAPWAYELLMSRHELRGDLRSALMTAERAVDRAPGWAAPHIWRYTLLLRLGIHDEARDAAVAAMGLPVWTHTVSFAPIAAATGWTPPIDGAPYVRLARDPERAPADRAAHLMDYAAVEDHPWSDVRDELGALYGEAGLRGVSSLVAHG
jgi:hypothetical protein